MKSGALTNTSADFAAVTIVSETADYNLKHTEYHVISGI